MAALAMPAMLDALELPEPVEVGWFVAAISPLYDSAEPAGWRYCYVADDMPDLLGICYRGPPAGCSCGPT